MTPKEKVLQVWPDAVAQKRGVLFYIQDGRDGDAIGFSLQSFELAWQDALNQLKQQTT